MAPWAAKWSVVVWADVTPDLERFLTQDRIAVAAALSGTTDIDLHVFEKRQGRQPSKEVFCWPPNNRPPQGRHSAGGGHRSIAGALGAVPCWNTANHRLLVLWGHGMDSLHPKDATLAVPEADDVTKAFAGSRRSISPPDIVGYDACRMATVHTAFGLEPLVHLPSASARAGSHPCYLIASMVPEPASGWPYFQVLQVLVGPSGDFPAAVASGLVEAYAASVERPDWCIVAVDLGKVAALHQALDQLLASTTAPEPVDFFTAAEGADIGDDTNLVDLGALMGRLDAVTPNGRGGFVQVPRAAGVRRRLLDAIVSSGAGGRLTGRDGLAIRLEVSPRNRAADWPKPPSWPMYIPNRPVRRAG